MAITLIIDTAGGANFQGFNLRNVGSLHVGGVSLPTTGYALQVTGKALVTTDLRVAGATELVGAVTLTGTLNGQTISDAANFTGALTVAGLLTTARLAAIVPDGTSPLIVNSTTVVPSLNADMLDGAHATAFASVGHVSAVNNPHAVTKAQVGLANVENTALSSWPGSTNLVTAGALVAASLNLGGVVVTNILTGTVAWDLTGLGGIGARASTTVTVTGAVVGDPVFVGVLGAGEDIIFSGHVEANDTVRVIAYRIAAASSNPGNQTIRAVVFKF